MIELLSDYGKKIKGIIPTVKALQCITVEPESMWKLLSFLEAETYAKLMKIESLTGVPGLKE